MRRTPLLSVAGLTCLVLAGCSLSSREQWAEINRHGLLPVIMEDRENRASPPRGQDAIRVQAVTSPVVVKTPTAAPVPGREGFAFTPYTTPLRIVDVRGFQPGEEVRCPFTGRAFLVPGGQSYAPLVAVQRPAPRITEVVSNSPSASPVDIPFTNLEVPVLPPPVETQPPAAHAAPAQASESPVPVPPSIEKTPIPYGTRVAGRPGFVYSPYAEKTQLVDVATTAPGVVVKCPYTDKLFRVPELADEELPPATSPPGESPVPVTPPEAVPPPDPALKPAQDPTPTPAPEPVQPTSPEPVPAAPTDAPPQP